MTEGMDNCDLKQIFFVLARECLFSMTLKISVFLADVLDFLGIGVKKRRDLKRDSITFVVLALLANTTSR